MVGCGSGSGSSSASTSTLFGIQRQRPLEVGAVSLPDVTKGEPGTEFAFRAQPGQLLVAYFGYTSCPDVCPTTLAFLRSARESLGDDAGRVDLAMVTVDPERDTAERLSGYLSSFADRYHAVRTADPARLAAAEKAFGAESQVTKNADGTVEVSHSATSYVVDDQGRVLDEWTFGTSSEDMAGDLAKLLARSPAA